MSARVVAARRPLYGLCGWRNGRFFGKLCEEAAAVVCHGLGRDYGFGRPRRSLCLRLREGELVVHEAPQADAYCYERRHRAAYAAWSSLALPHGPRSLPLLVKCVAPEACGRAVDSTALDANIARQTKRFSLGQPMG